MAIYRIQTSLQADSGLPRDQFVNSIHVDYDGALPGIYDGWCNAVRTFYLAISTYLSPVIAQNGHTSKVYAIAAPLESPPVFSTTWSFVTTPSGTAMPNEVASCLSYRAERNPLWERQSTYGRIYIGPVNTNTADTIPAGGSIPGVVFQSGVTNAASAMDDALTAAGATWVVYSKLHNLGSRVIEASMNNEWDTVRSRGFRATSRTVVPIT